MKFIYLLLTMTILLQATSDFSTNKDKYSVFGGGYIRICIDNVFYITKTSTSKALTVWINPKTLKPQNCNLEK